MIDETFIKVQSGYLSKYAQCDSIGGKEDWNGGRAKPEVVGKRIGGNNLTFQNIKNNHATRHALDLIRRKALLFIIFVLKVLS